MNKSHKKQMQTLLIELKNGVVTGVYRISVPMHLSSEVMVVNLDDHSTDIRCKPRDVSPSWRAGPETQKAIDKLKNVLPDPPR